jgi:hypothetical protein
LQLVHIRSMFSFLLMKPGSGVLPGEVVNTR